MVVIFTLIIVSILNNCAIIYIYADHREGQGKQRQRQITTNAFSLKGKGLVMAVTQPKVRQFLPLVRPKVSWLVQNSKSVD